MKIISWNVNSLKARAEYVERFLDAETPDVLCLQELKLTDDKVPVALFEDRGYHVATHGQRQWNGVLIASKQPLEDVHTGLPEGDQGQSRLIAATTGGVHLVNLYCPQGQSADSDKFEYKLAFYDALIHWLKEPAAAALPLLVLGDLNVAPKPEDVYDVKVFEGVPTYHPLEHARWQRLLDLGLTDVAMPHLEPGTYTFWDYRRAAFRFNRGMRIDHFLGNAAAAERITGAWVERPWRKKIDGLTASDHAPVAVTFE